MTLCTNQIASGPLTLKQVLLGHHILLPKCFWSMVLNPMCRDLKGKTQACWLHSEMCLTHECIMCHVLYVFVLF